MYYTERIDNFRSLVDQWCVYDTSRLDYKISNAFMAVGAKTHYSYAWPSFILTINRIGFDLFEIESFACLFDDSETRWRHFPELSESCTHLQHLRIRLINGTNMLLKENCTELLHAYLLSWNRLRGKLAMKQRWKLFVGSHQLKNRTQQIVGLECHEGRMHMYCVGRKA